MVVLEILVCVCCLLQLAAHVLVHTSSGVQRATDDHQAEATAEIARRMKHCILLSLRYMGAASNLSGKQLILGPRPKAIKKLPLISVLPKLIIKDGLVYYQLVMIAIALWATIRSPFLFSILLLDYLRLPIGSRVWVVIQEALPELGKLVPIVMIVLFINATLSFQWFDTSLKRSTSSPFRQDACSTAYQCVAQAFNLGLRGDTWWMHEGLDSEFQTGPFEDVHDLFHVAFVDLFFVIWNFFVLSAIFSAVITAATTLRIRTTKHEARIRKSCLVCSLPKEAFNDQPGQHDTFEEHTSTRHSLWFYLFFVFAAQHSPAAFSKGFAAYARTCISHGDPAILPFKQSFSGQHPTALETSVAEAKSVLQGLNSRQINELRHDPQLHHLWDQNHGDHVDDLHH